MFRPATGVALLAVVLASQTAPASAQAPVYNTLISQPSLSACTRDGSGTSPCRVLSGDSTVAADSTTEPAANVAGRSRTTMIFYGGLTAALVANLVVHVDRDPGGYRDDWRSEASFPDKGVHALAGFALTSVGVDMKLSPWRSALAVCAAGAAFEATQGYVSHYDIIADCSGAAAAALWRKWRAAR